MTNLSTYKLKTLRKSKNLTQQDVAKALNITRSFYGMIENGDRSPTLKLGIEISHFFDKSVEELFGQPLSRDTG